MKQGEEAKIQILGNVSGNSQLLRIQNAGISAYNRIHRCDCAVGNTKVLSVLLLKTMAVVLLNFTVRLWGGIFQCTNMDMEN